MIRFFAIFLMSCCCISGVSAKTQYANLNATGLNNGTSWLNAWTDLSVALDLHSSPGDTFWVAKGDYTSDNANGFAFGLSGIKMFGGFAGSETQLNQRNISTNKTTILSTNLFYTAVMIGSSSRLDGFTITNNNPAVMQATTYGIQIIGGLGGDSSVMENCIFTGHWAKTLIITLGGNVKFRRCQFLDNHAPYGTSAASNYGTAIRCGGRLTNVLIDDCLFWNNTGQCGGALQVFDSAIVTVNRSVFQGNEASLAGGAMYDSSGARLRVFNSLIIGNKAPLGGAHYGPDTTRGSRNFTHCTISGNWSSKAAFSNYVAWLRGYNDTLRNSIVWGDSTGIAAALEIPLPKGSAVFSRNVIGRGSGFPVASNTYTFDPLFVSPGNEANAPFSSSTTYNYHLAALSETIDTGLNLGLSAPFNRDLDSNARLQGPLPDLGAYEWKTCPWLNVIITPSGPTTFCQPGSVTLTASANPAYTHTYQWDLGTFSGSSVTVTTTGRSKVVVVDSLGCRSAAGVNVNAVPVPNPVITQTGNTLSVPAIYASYQWYLGAAPITGATSASFNPATNGNYSVKVTTVAGACPGTSAAYNLHNLAVTTPTGPSVDLYPNPGDGQFTISFEGSMTDVEITVIAMTGQEVYHQRYDSSPRYFRREVDLRNLSKGVYVIKIVSGSSSFLRRVEII